MSTISPHTTRASGTILTATIYNADHSNHISNAQALNLDKIEGATPPVIDGALVVFDGTAGNAIRDSSINESDFTTFGDVFGPASAVNENFARFDTTTGKLLEDSGYSIPTTAEVRSAAANRLMTTSQIESAAAPVSLTDAGTIAVDWDAGINFTVTLQGNRTLGNPTNGQPGTYRRVEVTQDATGSRTLAYGNQYRFPGGATLGAPVLTTTANAVDVLHIYCRSTTIFEVYLAGKDIKA